MHPVSEQEFDASAVRRTPQPEQVAEGVWTLPLTLGPGHVPYTLCYVVRDANNRLHIIDSSKDSPENWQAFTEGIAALGHSLDDIQTITVTHLHPDHIEMAARTREATGAPIAMHRLDQLGLNIMYGSDEAFTQVRADRIASWGVPDDRLDELAMFIKAASSRRAMVADTLLEHGQTLDIPGRTLEVVHTPGHTAGSICLRDADSKLLYLGDHILPTVYPGLGLGGPTESNPLADYFESLRVVSAWDDHQALPGHGYRFVGIAERAETIRQHHLRRSQQVAEALEASDSPTVWDIAAGAHWSAGWQNLTGFLLHSALAQTAMHIDYLGAKAEATGA